MASQDEGRCVSCGFLAKYARSDDMLHTDIYIEVNWSQRNRGDLFAPTPYQALTKPVCFKNEIPIASLIEERAKTLSGNRQSATREIIAEERHCQQWYSYIPGFNPKEHAERLAMQQLEQDRKKFELELFNMSQKVQEDSRAIAESTKKITKWIGLIALLLTLAQIVVGVLNYLASKRPTYIVVPTVQQPVEPKQDQTAPPKK